MKKILIALLLLGAASGSKAQSAGTAPFTNPYPRTITVTGSAELSTMPDQLFVSVRLREYNRKGEGKQSLEKIRAAFLQACQASGIADSLIRLISYSGADESPARRRRNQQPDLMASVTYELKLPNSAMIDALEGRMDDAATAYFGITRYTHSREMEFRRQLKIDAIRAAKDKAAYLAESIGEKVGVAVTIVEPEESGWNAGRVNLMSNTSSNVLTTTANVYTRTAATEENSNAFEAPAVRDVRYRYEVTVVFSLK